MCPFGTAPLDIASWVSLINDFADTGSRRLKCHPGQTGGLQLLIDTATLLGIQMPGFPHHGVGNPLMQLTSDQLAVGVGQFTPQRSRRAQPPRRRCWGDPAG